MAVCGDPGKRHGIVLAKNALAKKAGVKTAQPLWEAKLLSPGIVFLPADMESYIAYSRKAREIYYNYSDMFEPFGIDEGWLVSRGA